jgi:hypothetical protein
MRIRESSLAVLALVIAALPAAAQDRPVNGAGAAVGLALIHQPGRPFTGTTLGLPLLETEKDALGIGASAGLAGAFEVARFGDIPLFLEVSGSFAAASSASVAVHDLAGTDGFLFAVGNPSGTIDLDASGSSASAAVTSPAGGVLATGSTAPGGGSQAILAFNRAGGAGAFGAVFTSGEPSAASYGAVLVPGGFAFAGMGDMSGTRIRSSSARTSLRGGIEATLGAPIPLGDGWVVLPKVGAAYRLSGDDVRGELLIDPYEGPGLPDRFPTAGVRTEETLRSHMAGPVASLSLSGPVAPRWSVSVGVDAGWLFTGSEWTLAATGLMEGMAPTALPGSSASGSGGTAMVRAKAGVSYAAENGTVFSLNGQVEHLTAAPVAVTSASGGTTGGAPLDLSGIGATTVIGTMPTFDYAVSVSVSRRF